MRIRKAIANAASVGVFFVTNTYTVTGAENVIIAECKTRFAVIRVLTERNLRLQRPGILSDNQNINGITTISFGQNVCSGEIVTCTQNTRAFFNFLAINQIPFLKEQL